MLTDILLNFLFGVSPLQIFDLKGSEIKIFKKDHINSLVLLYIIFMRKGFSFCYQSQTHSQGMFPSHNVHIWSQRYRNRRLEIFI